jgi:hypothetical protein
VASGSAADAASARARGSSAWHTAVRMGLVGTLLGPDIAAWPAGGGSGAAWKRSATVHKRAPRALKWRPRQRGGVGGPKRPGRRSLVQCGSESVPAAGGRNRARCGGLGKSHEGLAHGTVKAPSPSGSGTQRERERES